jgi:hypothetical protein
VISNKRREINKDKNNLEEGFIKYGKISDSRNRNICKSSLSKYRSFLLAFYFIQIVRFR